MNGSNNWQAYPTPALPTQGTDEAAQKQLSKLREFLELQQLYRGAIKEVTTKLEILDEEFHTRHDHNPIHRIENRLKSLPSMAAKLNKRGLPLDISAIKSQLYDVAGVRVICGYCQDIYNVADILISQPDIRLIRRRDYIKEPKPNGYRSLHLVVEVPVFLSTGAVPVPVEIQLRTIAMDFWASLEHKLRYKSDAAISQDLCEELKRCADAGAMLDLQMQDIFNRISAGDGSGADGQS